MSVLSFLHSQLFITPPVPTYDFGGQTIIITGSNRGIGLEAARHLLALNAKRVVLAVRSTKNGNDASQDLEKSTGRSGAVQVEELDMASKESVKAFAARMEHLDRLDAVLLNAGMYTHEFSLADGHVMFKLPEWKENKPFEVLSDKERANMQQRYMITKLMVILLAREMSVHVDSSDVIINSFTPGYCESGLVSNIKGPTRIALDLLKKATARTTEVGGRTLVAAIVPWPESHGKYLNDSRIDDSALSAFVRSDEGAQAQKKLWKDLLTVLEHTNL